MLTFVTSDSGFSRVIFTGIDAVVDSVHQLEEVV